MKKIIRFSPGKILLATFAMFGALAAIQAYPQAVPAISNFSPNSGSVGTSLIISGASFSATAASNIVYFGAVQAAVLSASTNSLTVAVPSGATYAPITVTVNGLTASASMPFMPTFAGNGSGITASSFGTPQNLATLNGPEQTVIADLDGDGKPDLIVADTYNNSISIFRNISTNGTLAASSFAPRVDLAATSGTYSPFVVAVADVDGDGKLDIIATEYGDNLVSVYRNNCTPGNISSNSFATRVDFATGAGCQGVAVMDLDGDGRPDIVTANASDGTVSILRNTSVAGSLTTNSFAPKVDIATGAGCQRVAVGDLNSDGKPDIVAANNDGTISILQNIISFPGSITTNSFAQKISLAVPSGAVSVVIVDLDGDNQRDLAVTSYLPQTLSVIRNLNAGGNLTINSFAPRIDFPLNGRGHTIAVGDLDGDGKPDLAVDTELNSLVSLFRNVSMPGSFTNSSLAAQVELATGWNAWGISVGDLDGDGRPDIVFGNAYDANIQIYQNQTPFGTPPPICSPAPPGLVGWWKGEGNANDSAGMNNGSLSASGATYATGEVGQGFRFDGTDGYVQIPDSDALKPANVTCEAWVWLDPGLPSNNGAEQIVFKKNTWSAWFEGYSLAKTTIDNGDGTYSDCFQFCVSRYGNQVAINSQTIAQRGVWYHVAATYDGNQSKLYVNGVLEASATPGFALDYDTTPIFIGTTGTWAPYLSMFGGIIDEVSIYNRALSSNEIAAIYNAGSAGKCYALTAPVITSQPTNQTVLVSNAVTFAVTAGGTQPLNYQWNFNGTNIFGATNSSLALYNVSPAQAGNYSVLVTNFFGAVTSSNAVLTVYVPPTPPTIVAQTPNRVVLVGSAAIFSVTASGSDPLSYFWERNNALVPGATNSFYILANAQLSDSGSKFSCLVTNAYGAAASTNVSLKVIDTISNDLCSGAVVITSYNYTNAQSTFNASSYGDPVPDCIDGFGNGVWYQFTSPVNGLLFVDTFGSDFDTGLAAYVGSCDSLMEAVCNDDAGGGVTSQVILPATAGATYYFLAGGYGGHVGNLVFHLNYLTPPVFAVQPTNLSVIVSSNAILSPTLSGTQPMSFQWYFNNSPLVDDGRISGSTNSTLTIANVQTNDGGNYQLVASNIVGVTSSSVAVLTPIILPPAFTQQPVDQSVLIGSNVNFFAVVAGTPPYSYQWFLNGNALVDDGIHIVGSTTSSLNISNLTMADAGSYSLTVTNVSGATNAAATLTVLVPPAFTTQPVGRSVPPGLPTTFNAAASGNPAPSYYQWQLNGTNIPGATSASYTVAAVGTNDLGFYQVIASNSVGVATSAVAQLTFGPVAAWGRNISGESLPPPGLSNVISVAGCYGASFAVRADGTVVAWGSGSITDIPASASNVVAVSASPGGLDGAVALRSDGTVVSWGPVLAPTTLSNIVSVSVGDFRFGFALRAEGTLVGWGAIPYSMAPAGLNHVTAIACGYTHSLALRNDGTVVAWGAGVATNVPAGLANVTAIAAGYSHSLALKSNGTVVAWGSGTGINVPAGLTNVAAIYAGGSPQGQSLSLAIRYNGTVVAWGDNSYGEANPPAALSNLVSVAGAAAAFHSLALVNDGSPVILHPPVGLTAYTGRDVTLQASAAGAQPLSYQWLLNGTNVPGATNATLLIPNIQFANAGNYQLFVSNSINTAISLPAPVNVISNNTLTFLTQTTTGVTNYQGSKISLDGITVLGSGPLTYQWFFSTTNKNYAAVSGATNDALILDPALAVQSGNYYVAVSNLVNGITSAPVNVKVLFARAWGIQAVSNPPVNVTNAIAVATGGYLTSYGDYFALGADGKLASWANYTPIYGETNVSALSNSFVIAIAAGNQHTLALKSDGTVYAWGYGGYGQTNPPAGLNSVVAIACGGYHDLALKTDGTVVGWGDLQATNYGQAANNPAATNVVAIAAGNLHSLALRADGTVVGWGYSQDGSTTIPPAATNVIAIAAGSGFSAALRANGTVVQWGDGILQYPQFPIPSNLSNVVAISGSATHCTALRNDGTVVSWGYEYTGNASNNVPPDLANVSAIASGGSHDFGLLGTRAPTFTVQPWNRTVFNTATSVWFAAKCAGVQPVRYQWQLNGTNLPAATNDTLIVTGQSSGQGKPPLLASGSYQLIASNAYGVVASKYAKLTVQIPLGVALNATNLNWTTTGNAQWFGETNITHDGVSAAQSGGIGPLQESILQTTFGTNWSGRYTFWWKVSSEQFFDILEFRVNGVVQTNISGEVDWTQASIPVATGTNVLMWRYSKDATIDAGQDAGWVDQFAFIPDGPLITSQPVSQTVNMGTNVTFQVTATGQSKHQLTYQWRQNGNVLGANSPTLNLNNVGRAQDGTYFVTVTDVMNGVSTVSSNAVLKVLVPQLLGSPTLLPDGTFLLTSTDANGGLLQPSDLANFEAQASTNLANWMTLTNALSLTNGMLQLQDSSGTNWPARFYRILEH